MRAPALAPSQPRRCFGDKPTGQGAAAAQNPELQGDGAGNFTYLPNWKTNLSIEGSVRALETVQTKEGKKLVVGINDAKPLLISIQND